MSEIIFVFNLREGHIKLSVEKLQKNGGAQKEIERVLDEAGIKHGVVEITGAQPAKQKAYPQKAAKHTKTAQKL